MLQLDSQHLIDIEESMSRDPNVTDVRGDACKSRSHLEGLLGFLTGDAWRWCRETFKSSLHGQITRTTNKIAKRFALLQSNYKF